MENLELSHINKNGEAHMVSVNEKSITSRHARAMAEVIMKPQTIEKIIAGKMPKGDVLAVVRTAGIMAAKKTPDLIPLCHPLMLSGISIEIQPIKADVIMITADVSCSGQTGVEMEAMTAVSVAALTLYDMCKAIDREITISNICLLEKTGGKSGNWQRKVKEENNNG